jgi:hypothetical protein
MGPAAPAAFYRLNKLAASARTLWGLIAVTDLAVITPLALIPIGIIA